jgi:hypothetical protein
MHLRTSNIQGEAKRLRERDHYDILKFYCSQADVTAVVHSPNIKASCHLLISAKTNTTAADIAIAFETGAPRNHAAVGL